MALCTEQGFPFWLAMCTMLRGWALTEQGEMEEGMTQLRQGLAAWQATGTAILRPYWLALLAEAYGKVGQVEEGLSLLAEGLELVDKTEEHSHEAELYRLKGELLLARAAEHGTEAETCFRQALSIARHQQAKSWELRAAMSLARLWQSQDKRQDGYDLLALVYGWFTEGFDTADLQDAKALLNELGG